MEPLHIDLLVTDDDLTLGETADPAQTSDRAVIAQDIRHTIRESGLALQLIGLRNRIKQQQIYTQIELLVEEDDRLIPGTIRVEQTQQGNVFVIADTHDYGRIR